MMKKLFAILLILALVTMTAIAEERPRIILLTVYQQMGWGDRVDIGCVDEEGGLWTMTGSASKLGWSGTLEEKLAFLRSTDLLEPAGAFDADALFDLKGLVACTEPQEVKAVAAANDAGTEVSYALRYDADDSLDAVRLGMSGDDVYENTDPNAQALYALLRRLFPGVTCYGGSMGPAGFQPVPVAEFLGLDPDLVRDAELKAYYTDCEAGPIEVKSPDDSARRIVLEGTVVGKANATMTTGGTTVVSFYGADGSFVGTIELYNGLLVRGDGMYYIQ